MSSEDSGGELIKESLIMWRCFVIETVTIAENEAIQEHQALDAFWNRFRDFGDYGAAEAMSNENEV